MATAVGFRLGVDFGTSNTVAVLATPSGTMRQLLVDGAPVLPSAVCLTRDRRLVVGRDAVHAARTSPEGFDPNPKRRVDVPSVRLGGVDVAVVDMIAAVLGRVVGEARRVAGGTIESATLTYPAGWDRHRCGVLAAAATRAGLVSPQLVPEPVAAGFSFAHASEDAVPVGSTVVVYDFGAGTFDAAVIRRTPTGFEVLAADGLTDTGGINIDAAIVGYLGTVYSPRDRAAWQRLVEPSGSTDLRSSILLWDDVRAGKEMLSRQPATLVHIPVFETDAPLGREQFNELARPILVRTVEATRAVIAQARIAPSSIAGLFLVGGSSRIPLAATLLHQQLGIAPTVVETPELAVAEGSLRSLGLVAQARPHERVDLVRGGVGGPYAAVGGPAYGHGPAYSTGPVHAGYPGDPAYSGGPAYAGGPARAAGPAPGGSRTAGPQPVWAGSPGAAPPGTAGRSPGRPDQPPRGRPDAPPPGRPDAHPGRGSDGPDRTAPLWPQQAATAPPTPSRAEPASSPFGPDPTLQMPPVTPTRPMPAVQPGEPLPGDEPTIMWRVPDEPPAPEPPPFEPPPPVPLDQLPPPVAPEDDEGAFEWPDDEDTPAPQAGVLWVGTAPPAPPRRAPAAPAPPPAAGAAPPAPPRREAAPAPPRRPARPPLQPPESARPPAASAPVEEPLPVSGQSAPPAADPAAEREELRRALRSVRTRIDVVENRLGTVPEMMSTLRRRFVLPAFQDVEPMHARAARQLRTAREIFAIAERHADAGTWQTVRTAIADTRQALEEATAAIAEITGRLAVLEELAADPKGPVEQARFAVRDAQRLFQMLTPGVPAEYGRRLDGLSARVDAAAKALALPRPNYWELHNQLTAVREQTRETIVAMRAAR